MSEPTNNIEDLVYRLRKRAEIRRQITTRKLLFYLKELPQIKYHVKIFDNLSILSQHRDSQHRDNLTDMTFINFLGYLPIIVPAEFNIQNAKVLCGR